MKLNKILPSIVVSALLSTKLFAGGDFIVPAVPIEPVEVTPELEPIFYVGIGAVASGLSRNCVCKAKAKRLKDMTYGFVLKAGMDITDYIGIEARYINASIENDFSEMVHYGLYLKPQYLIEDDISVYGLLGYGKTTVDYTFGKRTSTLDKSGLSYGAGLEYALDDNLGLWVDLQHIFSKEGTFDTDLNLGTAGVTYNF